jgi:SAM-dependent methyltransferase
MPTSDEKTIGLHERFLRSYWAETPFPLAFERTWECKLLARRRFVRPVLDVGCGEGLFAHMLFREPLETGIDPNGHELERAERLGAYRELIKCPGDRIPKPDGAYQTIFSNSVLEHIPDLDPVLIEMRRLLAPGGRMYVTVPSHRYDHYTMVNQTLSLLGLNGLAQRYRTFFNGFWRHYHYHDLAGWQSRFTQHGFQVLESCTYGPKALCLLNDLLVPACLPSMVLKRLANRWTLLPAVRRLLLSPLAVLGERLAERGTHAEEGGLVFVVLGKQAEAQMLAKSA